MRRVREAFSRTSRSHGSKSAYSEPQEPADASRSPRPPSGSGLENWRRHIPRTSLTSPDHLNGFIALETERTDMYNTAEPFREVVPPLDPHYVYYRVFMGDQPRPSRNPVYPNEGHLGRILATLVAPPQTVDSLKRCIARTEGITNVLNCDLYANQKIQTPMGQGPISILGDDCIGSTPASAMVLVYHVATQEIASAIPIPIVDVNSRFNKKIVAVQECNYSSMNPKFLNLKRDEVLFTDGESHWQPFAGGGGGKGAARPFEVYEAINSVDLKGYVMKDAVRRSR